MQMSYSNYTSYLANRAICCCNSKNSGSVGGATTQIYERITPHLNPSHFRFLPLILKIRRVYLQMLI